MRHDTDLKSTSLLLLEDDVELRGLLADALRAAGIEVGEAGSCQQAQKLLRERSFELAVLDVQLPDGSGLGVVSQLKRSSPSTGIIVLTRMQDPAWQIAGYDVGADLYLPKPVYPDVLLAAVRRLRERVSALAVSIEPSVWQLLDDGWTLRAPSAAKLELNELERGLLQCVFAGAGQVVERSDLSAKLTPLDESFTPQRLDMLVHRLRRKIEEQGFPELPLRAVRGQGYVLALPRVAAS